MRYSLVEMLEMTTSQKKDDERPERQDQNIDPEAMEQLVGTSQEEDSIANNAELQKLMRYSVNVGHPNSAEFVLLRTENKKLKIYYFSIKISLYSNK